MVSIADEVMAPGVDAAPISIAPGPELDIDQIQGDVLLGLQKFLERFIFFQIVDAPGLKSVLRSSFAGLVTTLRTVQSREDEIASWKAQGQTEPLNLPGLNLGFTQSGLQKLMPGATLADASFFAGALAKAPALGDPMNAGAPATWLNPFVSGNIDGILLITGEAADAVNAQAAQILGLLGATASVVYDETGSVRPGNARGHEHFGWQDGISQPGINGLSTPLSGQRALDPGLFVFGYPGEPSPPSAPWMKNGSLMVFRRLNQLVPEFRQFLLSEATRLGMDPVLLGARVLGRWQSGAPLTLAPAQDDASLAEDPQQNNHFDLSEDPDQRRCPYGAHIRKTNPRQDLMPQESAIDPHRILRQGIPFGPEVSAAEAEAHATQQERGLMFVCYQTSIVNQFEFVQINWANNPGFVFGKKHPDGSSVLVGHDPIIGQTNSGGPSAGNTTGSAGNSRARFMDEPVPNDPDGNARSTLQMPRDFVVPTGGAYFFVPSISALQNELSA